MFNWTDDALDVIEVFEVNNTLRIFITNSAGDVCAIDLPTIAVSELTDKLIEWLQESP